MDEEVILDPAQKKELAGIIQKMESAKESPENIKAVVARYHEKNAKKSTPITNESGGISLDEPKKFSKKGELPNSRPIDIKKGVTLSLERKGEDPRDKVIRYKDEKLIADTPNRAVDSRIRKTIDNKVDSFNQEFRPTVAEIRDYVALNDESTPDEVKTKLGLSSEYDDQINKAFESRKEKINFYNNQTPYKEYSTKEADPFVDIYFGKDKLKAIGIDPEDFDGYLEANKKKQGFSDLANKGFFEEGGQSTLIGTDPNYNKKLAYDLHKLDLINSYFDDNTARDKSLAAEYFKQAANGSEKAKDKYVETIKRLQSKTEGYKNFINENLPTYVSHEQLKNEKLKEQYKKYKEGNADEFLNWGRGLWEGAVQAVHGISATTYDLLGADDTATQIRLQKEQESRYDSVPDLYYISESGKAVNYKGTNYLVTSKGDIIDTDDKLKATSLLDPEDYNSIMKKSEESTNTETSNSIGGALQQSSGVIGDMAVQILLTKGVGKTTNLVRSGASSVANSEITFAMENALGRTSLGKSIYSRAAANTFEREVLNTTPLLSKLTKVPAVYADVLITQGAYGYSTGYENTYNAMIQAGHSDADAKEIAAEAGTQMAALFGATAFIAPQTHILQSLEGNSVKNLIKRGVSQIEKEGKEGFVKTLNEGAKSMLKNTKVTAKDLLNKDTRGATLKEIGKDVMSSNAVQGGIKAVNEAGKEVVQENIQQYGENVGVNSNINDLIGEDLLKDTYTMEDFKNTTVLAFSAALMLNSPSMVTGVDKMSVLSKLSNNQDNFESSLKHYVKSGLATQEQADALKKDVQIFSRYKNMIPPETNNKVAFEIMTRLSNIDDITTKMETVHPALKEAYKNRIEKEKSIVNSMLGGEDVTIDETKKNEKPTLENQIPDSGVITSREAQWDLNTKETLPDSKFKTEEDFKETIKNGTWGMLTAENPNSEQVSDDANFNNNEKAIQWLESKGYKPQPIFGKYGNSENSFFVENLSKQDAIDFAKEFKQESVATNEGLVYQDGKMNPRVKGSESFTTKEDFYSSIKIGGKNIDYSVDYDFDTKVNVTNEAVNEDVKQEVKPSEKYKEVADKIRSAKFYKTPSDALNRLNTDLTAPLKFAWDTTMEVIATSVEQSGNLAKAINKGVKHLKTTDWYKQLSSEGKKEAVNLMTKEATDNLTPLASSIKPKTKTSTKAIIRKNTGQTDTSKKVETTESKLLKLKLKTAEQAQRVQRSFDNKNRSAAVANLRSLVETLSKKGLVSPSILKSMLKGAVNLNTSDEAAVAKFMEKVNGVISKINDRTKITEVRKLKKGVKNLSKTAPANVRELGKAAVGINENYLTSDEIQTYVEILTDIRNSNYPAQSNKQKMVDVDKAYNDLQKLVDAAELSRIEEIKESMSLLGVDIADLGMTDSELKDFWDTELDIDGSTLEDRKQDALDKANKLREVLQSIAQAYKGSLSSFNFDSITSEKSKEVAKKLPQAKIEYMDAVSLKEYIKAVQNLTTNNSLAGAGKIASQIQSVNNMIAFVTKVVNSGIPLGSIKLDTKLTKGNFLNDMKSLALLMKEVYKTPELMGDFNYYSGLDALSKGQVKVDREIHNTTKELDLLFNKLAKDNKSLRSSENTVLRGIVSNLIQGNTEEEFEINKSRVEDHINKTDENADEIQSIYDNFKGFKNQQEVLDYLKSRNDGNYELIMFWRNKFDGIKDQLKENTEVVHNEIFNEVSENYLPIKIKVDGSASLSEAGSTFNYGGITSPKQSSTTIKRNKSKKLPVNGELDLDFDRAMINRFRMGLNDIQTASSMQQIRGFFGSKQINSLMGKKNTQAFVRRVNYMQRLGSGTLNEITDSERAASKVERIFKRIGVTAALGGVTAIIKQTVPVMTQVAAQVGTKNIGKFISNFRASQNNTLLEDYSTSMRGKSLLGTKSIMDSANELNKYKGFEGGVSKISRKAGQFFDKTRDVLMKPLQYGDEAVAKAAWTTYYLEYLGKNGYDTNKIDLSKENEKIADDEVRQRAASYAEVRVEETQVASNSQRSASLFSNPHIGIAALRSIFLPFQQFNINSKMRMLLDISEIMNTRKNGKFAKQVSNMTPDQIIQSVMDGKMLNNAHTSFKGKNLALKKSVKSLGATVLEQAMFQGIKAFALTLFTSHSAALYKFLIDDEDDSDTTHQEWLEKDIDWKFKGKQFYSNLTKDLNPLLIGNYMEDKQIDLLNRFHYLFGNDSEEFETYKQWADAYKKENKSLPFYTYDNKGKGTYGIYSIPIDIANHVLENGDFAYDGEAHITNDWGKEESFILENKSQLRFMRMMFVMEVLRSTTGVEADSYRELEKVRKELIKTSKVKN